MDTRWIEQIQDRARTPVRVLVEGKQDVLRGTLPPATASITTVREPETDDIIADEEISFLSSILSLFSFRNPLEINGRALDAVSNFWRFNLQTLDESFQLQIRGVI